MNPAKTIQKNPLKFADDPILPLWMNQAKTIQKTALKFVYDPSPVVDESSYNYLEECFKIANDPILPQWINQARTIQVNPRQIKK